MRRALTLLIFAALAVPATAEAHARVEPASLAPLVETTVTFAVPDELREPVVAVSVTLDRFALEAAEAKAGWRASRTRRTVTWRGGPIRRGEFATFALTGSPPASGTVRFVVAESGSSGASARFPAPVTVAARAPAARDEGARTLGKVGIGIGVAAAVVGVGAFFLGLARWLKNG